MAREMGVRFQKRKSASAGKDNFSDNQHQARDVFGHEHVAHADWRQKINLNAEAVGAKNVVEAGENAEHH